ncbi:MAG: phosphatase PAP2 family protein [Actinobacteria bacterium]|jgi:undecaprenyl-diphosphatase|nr:phosphatase PAP2 family protein [Micrococcales bacterium]MCB0903921.1 phosphatase PAP2 family protein [Actinomycetota bacterium]MCO5299882.1 phosphatase PAP2 family protein [Candidatus Nanopelagicales bacterium]MCB9429648.1 phosphatase PAP2 family protein [Actinomycetota bacterium]HPE13700.1 phosphatase PAP2 family protein [Actinomycetota bacterium]
MPGLRETDRELYEAIGQAGSPEVDLALRRLSRAANYSRLWVGSAAVLAGLGGPTGRRAAATGMVSVGLTSAVVNQGFKRVFRRDRPLRVDEDLNRHVRMPTSTSFPSGHSASAFAFAQGVSDTMPWTGIGLRILATAVAYSRIHTGVHYPADVAVGALIGMGIGQSTADLVSKRWP